MTALAAIALPTNAALAALLGGIIAGMGIVGSVFAVELLLWERARNVGCSRLPASRPSCTSARPSLLETSGGPPRTRPTFYRSSSRSQRPR